MISTPIQSADPALTPLLRFIERLPDLAQVADPGYELFMGPSGRVVGRLGGAQLSSRFAPLRDADGRLHAVAALPEATDPATGQPLAPEAVYAPSLSDEELVALDRRARLVHLLNFFGQFAEDVPAPVRACVLHLTVHPRLPTAVSADHGRAFRRVADSFGVPLSRLALVLPTLPEGREDLLANVLASYRLNGFSAQFSPTSRTQARRLLGRIGPDGMRIDAGTLAGSDEQAEADARDLARTLRGLRPGGIPLVATGVDSAVVRTRAIAAGATLLQGEAAGGAVVRLADLVG
jgi:hypothetical protein